MNKIELIKKHEGLRLRPYTCSAGKITIGYGRNIEDNGISEEEAELMLCNDVSSIESELKNKFYWFSNLSEVRKSAITNMAFNLGMPTFKKFKNTISAIESQDWDQAANEMLNSKWALQVKGRATELAKMVRTNEWPR